MAASNLPGRPRPAFVSEFIVQCTETPVSLSALHADSDFIHLRAQRNWDACRLHVYSYCWQV